MIIVTGGTSGIGKAITVSLRSTGVRVITISRKPRFGDSEHIACDITDYNSLKESYRFINGMNQKISAVINCAGIASMNLAITTPPDVTESLIKTNLLGTIFCNQIFSPLLIKNKGGCIINFSTIAVHIGLKGESVYVASKAGVEAFSRVLAKELSAFNINVNCIAPGPIRTNLLKGITDKQIDQIVNQQIHKREMLLSDIVSTVNLLLSDESSAITGQVLHIGGI